MSHLADMIIRWIALDRLKQADQSDTLVTSGSPNINNHGADERHLSLNVNNPGLLLLRLLFYLFKFRFIYFFTPYEASQVSFQNVAIIINKLFVKLSNFLFKLLVR